MLVLSSLNSRFNKNIVYSGKTKAALELSEESHVTCNNVGSTNQEHVQRHKCLYQDCCGCHQPLGQDLTFCGENRQNRKLHRKFFCPHCFVLQYFYNGICSSESYLD